MQPSTIDSYRRSIAALSFFRRVTLCFLAMLLSAILVLALAEATILHARQAPNRRDRRPDRETTIRYPRTQSQSSTHKDNGTLLQSAPPTPQGSRPSASPNSSLGND